MKKILICLSALPLMAFAPLASALTCDEVELGYDITSKFPTAQEACVEVVERDGSQFVKMRVELARNPRGNTATFRFLHADGSHGPTYSATVDPTWRTNIGGSSYRLRDLSMGQELSVYLPSDRWEAHVDSPEWVVETFSFVVITAAEPEPMMLPSTASKMPLFALFGVLALLGAGMIRVTRRQTS